MIIASTYRNLNDFVIPMLTDEMWEQMGQPQAWDEAVEAYNKVNQIIVFKNGSYIFLRSCDRPDDLRGPNLSWFAIDEAAKVPHKVWKLMVARLRLPPEKGWITTTPRGRNWVWEEFASRKRANYAYVTGSTEENPHISREFVESLKESYSGSFLAQEVYGEFIGWEGLVYQIDMEKHHRETPKPKSDNYKYAIGGCDWGWVDPSVILVALVGHEGELHLVEEYYEKKKHIDEIAEVAVRLSDKWGIRTFYCDPARPEYINKLRSCGLDARKGKRELEPGIAIVNKYLNDGMLFMDYNNVPNTIGEFESYHYEEDDTGSILRNKPIDKNNHAMDALRYLIQGHANIGYIGCRGIHR